MNETEARSYAAAVVDVLLPHFPDLADPDVAATTRDAIKRQALSPRDSFEFIVDDPWSARWRLKAYSRDRRRVHLAHFPVIQPGSASAAEFERTANDALYRVSPGTEEGQR